MVNGVNERDAHMILPCELSKAEREATCWHYTANVGSISSCVDSSSFPTVFLLRSEEAARVFRVWK